MACKTIFVVSLLVGLMFLVKSSFATKHHYAEDYHNVPVLSTFREVDYNFVRGPGGRYAFSFSLPQQTRTEQRHADGKVTGSYSFVDSFGQVVTVRYTADENGYHPQSDAIPQAQRYTEDVSLARERFFKNYQIRAKLHEQLASDEDESSEESSEQSYEDYYGSSSSEEDDESDEDDREYGKRRG